MRPMAQAAWKADLVGAQQPREGRLGREGVPQPAQLPGVGPVVAAAGGELRDGAAARGDEGGPPVDAAEEAGEGELLLEPVGPPGGDLRERLVVGFVVQGALIDSPYHTNNRLSHGKDTRNPRSRTTAVLRKPGTGGPGPMQAAPTSSTPRKPTAGARDGP